MSLDGVYDPDNIFARIVRGEVPCARVFEDADTLAFMDAFPQSRGHALAVHKRSHARNLLDVAADDLCALAVTTQRVTRAVRAALEPDGLRIMQFNGSAAGQTIFHLHVHILPVWSAVPLGRHAATPADPAELAELARLITARIAP
jgi:histidine triad (HIT) family protein